MKCPECGASIPKKTRFCTCCGAPILGNIQNLNLGNNSDSVIPPIKQVVNNQIPPQTNQPVIPQPDKSFIGNKQNPNEPGGKKSKGWVIVLIVSASVLLAVAIALAVCAALGLFNGDSDKNAQQGGYASYYSSITETIVTETQQPQTNPPETVKVPDVVGLSKEDAVEKISNAGLIHSVSETDSQTVPKGFVVSQSPVSGSSIEKGETITIYISNKSEPTVAPTSPPADNKTYLYCCASDFATLRTGPSRSNAEIVKIKSREQVEMLGTDGEFYYVSYKGKKGYVLKDFFSKDKNAPLNYGTGNP